MSRDGSHSPGAAQALLIQEESKEDRAAMILAMEKLKEEMRETARKLEKAKARKKKEKEKVIYVTHLEGFYFFTSFDWNENVYSYNAKLFADSVAVAALSSVHCPYITSLHYNYHLSVYRA